MSSLSLGFAEPASCDPEGRPVQGKWITDLENKIGESVAIVARGTPESSGTQVALFSYNAYIDPDIHRLNGVFDIVSDEEHFNGAPSKKKRVFGVCTIY